MPLAAINLPLLDTLILVSYLAVIVAWGCGFVQKATSAEAFMSAGRGMPAWVVGLSMFGSYVSSITFLGNPGKAYKDNWNVWVFALSLPLAALIATSSFVPFFRSSRALSAYHHLEDRFGPWARTYGVVCYLLTQIARLGSGIYLLALALRQLTGLEMPTLIILSGFVITIYPLFGGTEGVIWTGVVQAIVLVVGAAACLLVLLINMPGGPTAIIEYGTAAGKFSLGPYDLSLTHQTFWVVLLMGMATNLQNFGIDQSYVQRYITAKSDAGAGRSVWMSALCYIPLSAGFLFIGTALFVFYSLLPEQLPAGTKPDDVFPHFLHTQLPTGLRGLVLAAICSAAMDSNLNCCATLYLCDLRMRYIRPVATDRENLWVLRIATLLMGALGTAMAIKMIEVKSILDYWWSLASICSGGTLGLFLLGRMSRRARSLDAFLGTVCGVGVILWMTLVPRTDKLTDWWRSPFHTQMAIVFGTLTILLVGSLISLRHIAAGESPIPTSSIERG